MKKIFFALLTFVFTAFPALSAEKMTVKVFPKTNYLILLEKSADVVMPNDENILTAKVLTTIYDKKQIIVKVLKEGNAKLYVVMGDDIAIIEFNSDLENFYSTNYKCSKNVEAFVKLDKPYTPKLGNQKPKSTDFRLDEPPPLGGFKK